MEGMGVVNLEIHGGDPYRIEPHACDIIQVLRCTSIGAAAVLRNVSARVCGPIRLGEAVREELINGATAPIAWAPCPR